MNNDKKTWLPHLQEAVPPAARGKGTCMYIMALEGWRRGLELNFIKGNGTNLLKSVSFSLSDGTKEHVFSGSRGDAVTKEATKICTNKVLTNNYLADADVPIPGGESFSGDATNEQIIAYANSLGYPVVIKPSSSDGGGAGVITNIKSEEDMKEALDKVRIKQIPVIVERFFTGDDYRVYVLDGKVIGAFHRRTASIVGDGESDITTLIDKKNKERQKSPFLKNSNVKLNNDMKSFLQNKQLSPSSVPRKGERIFLRRDGEYFKERDAVNVTETLSDELKEIAVSAVDAIPGLPQAGVDMLIDLDNNAGVVNEVNSRAQISNHVFPFEGEAIDIPKYIIDDYFPETRNTKLTDVKYIYDFKPVKDAVKMEAPSEINIPPMPVGLKSVKRYVVRGHNFDDTYFQWLQDQAKQKNLHGYVRTIDNQSISVVVSGSEYVVNNFKGIMEEQSPESTKITSIETKKFNKPVKVGFEIKSNKHFEKQQKAHVEANRPRKLLTPFIPGIIKRILRKLQRQ